jgi:hypothetical protein
MQKDLCSSEFFRPKLNGLRLEQNYVIHIYIAFCIKHFPTNLLLYILMYVVSLDFVKLYLLKCTCSRLAIQSNFGSSNSSRQLKYVRAIGSIQ